MTLFAQNSAEWVLSYIGIAKAGAVINPVNAMLTADELAYVVKDCGAKVLITTSERAKTALHLKQDGSLKEIVVLGGAPIEGTISFERSAGGASRYDRSAGQRSRRSVDDLLHLRHDGISQGRDAQPPQRRAERGDDGGDEHADRARRPVHRPAIGACLRHGGDELELPARPDLRDAGEIRHPTGARIDPAPQGHHHGRRADDVSLHAVVSRLRQIRPVVAAHRGGRRTGHAGGKGHRMAGARRHADPRAVGHDRTGRSRHHAAFLLRQQAGLGRHPDAVHAGPHRRPGGSVENAAARRGRRADGQGPVHDARLLRQRKGHGRCHRAGRLAALRRSLQDGRRTDTSTSSIARRT